MNRLGTIPSVEANDDQLISAEWVRLNAPFRTVAQLTAFTSLQVAAIPYVNITDAGKEGAFIYDPTDTTTAHNLGTVIVTASGARYKRALTDFVKPEWFGATGNGSTDDTTSIQNALNYAASNGLTVQFWRKSYKISSLNAPDNTTIIGNNATLTQVKLTSDAIPVLVLGNKNKVSYLNIICEPVLNEEANNGGIYAGSKSDIEVSNCYIRNHGAFGLQLSNCKRATIRNNRFWTNYQLSSITSPHGVWTNSSDIYIYSPSSGVSENILVEGNRCNSPFTSQGIWANGEGNDREIIISHNLCVTTNEDGTDWANTNYFYDSGNGMIRRHGIQFGYQGFSGCGSAVISSNICRRTLVTGIYIAGQGIGKGVVIANNHCIENGYTANTDDFNAAGIHVGAGLGNLLVTGNQIVDFKCTRPLSGAINIQRNTLVANNHNITLADNAVVNSAGHGYRIQSGADRVVINGGSITNSALIDIYYDNAPSTLDHWLSINMY